MCVKFSFSFNFSVHKNLLPKTTDVYFKNFNKYRVSNKVQLQSIDGISPTFFFIFISLLCLVVFFAQSVKSIISFFTNSFFSPSSLLGGMKKDFLAFFLYDFQQDLICFCCHQLRCFSFTLLSLTRFLNIFQAMQRLTLLPGL